MHTKPISTKVIASYEATLISGFAFDLYYDNVTKKFNIPTAGLDILSRPLSIIEQSVLDVLNAETDKVFLPVSDMLKFILVLRQTKVEHLCSSGPSFEAVVVYPYIRENFALTDGMAKLLQNQICEQFSHTTDHHVGDALMAYLEKLDVTGRWSSNSNPLFDVTDCDGVDMLGYEDALKSLQEGTLVREARLFTDFPLELLPRAPDQGKAVNAFQRKWEWIDGRTAEEGIPHARLYQSVQKTLLPVLYIIAKMPKPTQKRGMEEDEKINLFMDLSAAKLFDDKLRKTEVREQEVAEGQEDETSPSLTVSQTIDLVLDSMSFNGSDASEEDLKGRDIYKFLVAYHRIAKEFSAISACIGLVANPENNEPSSKSIQIAERSKGELKSLIRFNDIFKDDNRSADSVRASEMIEDIYRSIEIEEEEGRRWSILSERL